MAVDSGKSGPVPGTSENPTAAHHDPVQLPTATAGIHPHPASSHRKILFIAGAIVLLVVILIFGVPFVSSVLNTVSTDDAYVNGHFTFVAPRVSGQVTRVLVDDNNRVRKGDLLVQLDKEPYQVQVDIQNAAVKAAEAGVASAEATVRGLEGEARSLRWKLQHAMEEVNDQIALLRTNVAALDSAKAVQTRAQNDYDRAKSLVASGAVAKEELDRRGRCWLSPMPRSSRRLKGSIRFA